jgi:hypothetical protein
MRKCGLRASSCVNIDHKYTGWNKINYTVSYIKMNAYRILVGNPEGKRPLGIPSRRWINKIKIGLREIRCDGGDWIDLAQERDQWTALVNAVMNLRFP